MIEIEKYGIYLLILGAVIVALGGFWLFVRALKILLPHWRRAVGPMLVLLLGVVILAIPYGVRYYYEWFVDLGPREKRVDGELHLTLTGWDGTDYSILRARPHTVVLQMANPDVTDQTLEHLREMSRLRELDLSDTQVTDEGLRLLSALPQLATLRLKDTKITDNGFREFLLAKETLLELDVRGTQVASKTVREWKEAKKEERKYLR